MPGTEERHQGCDEYPETYNMQQHTPLVCGGKKRINVVKEGLRETYAPSVCRKFSFIFFAYVFRFTNFFRCLPTVVSVIW